MTLFLAGCACGCAVSAVLSFLAMRLFRGEAQEVVEWVAPEKIEPSGNFGELPGKDAPSEVDG